MRVPRILAAAALVGMLSACVGLPPYKAPPAGPETATVDVSRMNASSICTDGTLYSVGRVKDGRLTVPTTSRVALYSWVYISDYDTSYSCMPGVSFKPEAGGSYLMNLELESKGCRVEVYRQGADNRIGLDVEASAAPPQYCR